MKRNNGFVSPRGWILPVALLMLGVYACGVTGANGPTGRDGPIRRMSFVHPGAGQGGIPFFGNRFASDCQALRI
jgi:hypothetical protein